MPSEITFINRKLREDYGKGILIRNALVGFVTRDISVDLPTLRVVWSTDQREKRYGEYRVFSESGSIFLRDEQTVEEVRKYDWLDKWVLECLLPTDGNPYLEKAGVKYSYEPLWVFGNANSNPQPIWKYIKVFVDEYMSSGRVKKTMKQLEDEEREKLEAAKAHDLEIIRNDSPDIPFQLKHGLAVVVPSNYTKE